VIDPALRETKMSYDRLGRLTSTTDALGNVSRQEYDPEGRVVARVDARGYRTTMQ
jgi:YD repeat-containing protein